MSLVHSHTTFCFTIYYHHLISLIFFYALFLVLCDPPSDTLILWQSVIFSLPNQSKRFLAYPPPVSINHLLIFIQGIRKAKMYKETMPSRSQVHRPLSLSQNLWLPLLFSSLPVQLLI